MKIMKKIFILPLLAFIVFCGCSKNEISSGKAVEGENLTIGLNASEFKAVFNEETAKTEWTSEDKFGVIHEYGYRDGDVTVYAENPNQQKFNLKSSEGASAIIESDGPFVWVTPAQGVTVTGYKFYMYYPYNAGTSGKGGVKGVLPATQNYDMSGNWDVSSYDFMYAPAVEIANKETPVNFSSMNHVFSILRFEFNNDTAKDYEIKSVKLENESGRSIAGEFTAAIDKENPAECVSFTTQAPAVTSFVSNGKIAAGESGSVRLMLDGYSLKGDVLRLTVTAADGSVKQVRFVGAEIHAGGMAAKKIKVSDLKNIWCDIEGKGSVNFVTLDAKDEGTPVETRQKYWKTMGQLFSDNAPTVWAEFVQNPANKAYPKQPSFSLAANTGKTFVVKAMFTGDAILFHVPAKLIPEDKQLVFKANAYISGTNSAYYMAEFSGDGGTSWTPAETGMETVKSTFLKKDSNLYFHDAEGKPAKVNVAVKACCAFGKEIAETEVLFRLVCVDGTSTPKADPQTEPSSNEFSFGCYDSSTNMSFCLEKVVKPTPVESYYDFSKGPASFDTGAGMDTRQPAWATSGKLQADNTSCIYAQFVQNPANSTFPNQPSFGYTTANAGGCCFHTGCWFTGDALVFHVPAKAIAAGKNLVLNIKINTTGSACQFYVAEYSLDGGSNWSLANTGEEVRTSTALGATSNIYYAAKGTKTLAVKCPISETLAEKEILIRFAVADGKQTISKGTQEAPNDTKDNIKIGGSGAITIEVADPS